MDVGLITEPRKFLCSLFFSNYLVRLIPHSAHNKWYQSRRFVLGGYSTVHVYGIVHVYDTIHVYDIVHVYGTVHEYGGDGHLYLGDNLL